MVARKRPIVTFAKHETDNDNPRLKLVRNDAMMNIQQVDSEIAVKAGFALEQLSPGQQALIRSLFGLETNTPVSASEIAAALGVSSDVVEGAADEALRALRRPLPAGKIKLDA